MTKQNTLQARLAQSLDKMNKREAKTHTAAPAALPVGEDRKCKKLSI